MPYGISAQSVLGAGGSRGAPREDGGGVAANTQQPPRKQGHFGGEARATSTSSTFAGAMRALLKPTPPPAAAPAPAAVAAPSAPGAERVVWRPRSALDASGHSFSKTLKAEISKSKQQRSDALPTSDGGRGGRNGGWWDGGGLGGGGLDDSMVHAPQHSRSNLHGPARVPMASGNRAGSAGVLHHQQQQQHRHHHQPSLPKSVSLRRKKSYRDQCLDEISRAVGLQ